MATEGNQPGLYGALYNAMTDPELIGDLLQHPEFLSKARIICNRIASPAGSEELLQETCLRVLDRVSQLNPNSIRNEGEFFEWFSQLARYVHLSKQWSKAAVSRCTEAAAGWPDALADVQDDDVDRFLNHVDACPYHTRLLHAEDEKLRAIFRRARGLDSKGRILHGPELRTRIIEHQRRMQNWREAAFKEGRLFGQVALFNAGKEIASCGRFYDFSIHISRNELDPVAGLQILGVTNSNPAEHVLLGFYPLAGVRHGDKEQTLKLDNGYTVGLKVKPVSETTFEIRFRCVETKTPEAEHEVDDLADIIIETIDDERPDNSFGALPPLIPLPVPPVSAGLWSRSPGWQIAAVFGLMVLVAVPSLELGKKWGQRAANNETVAHATKSQTDPLPPVPPSPKNDDQLNPRTPSSPTQRDSGERPKHQPPRQDEGVFMKAPPSTVSNQFALVVRDNLYENNDLVEAAEAATYETKPAVSLVHHESDELIVPIERKDAAKIDDQRSTPTLLRSFYLRESSTGRSWTRTSVSFRDVSSESRLDPNINSVLHVATNDTLVRKISRALKSRYLSYEPVAPQGEEKARLKVVWAASTEPSWETDWFVVKLKIYIHRGSEEKSFFEDSYKGEGPNLDAAYEDAVGKAITQVLNWITKDSGGNLSASASGTGDVDQSVQESKEELGGEVQLCGGINPIVRSRSRTQPGWEKDVNDRPKQAEEETEEN